MNEKEFIAKAREVLGEFYHTPCVGCECDKCLLGKKNLCDQLITLASMLEVSA